MQAPLMTYIISGAVMHHLGFHGNSTFGGVKWKSSKTSWKHFLSCNGPFVLFCGTFCCKTVLFFTYLTIKLVKMAGNDAAVTFYMLYTSASILCCKIARKEVENVKLRTTLQTRVLSSA